jgi:hypothetical protein
MVVFQNVDAIGEQVCRIGVHEMRGRRS